MLSRCAGWEHFLSWALSGLLYTLAGIFAFVNPVLTSTVFTLLLAVTLVVAGVFRVFVGRRLKLAGMGLDRLRRRRDGSCRLSSSYWLAGE